MDKTSRSRAVLCLPTSVSLAQPNSGPWYAIFMVWSTTLRLPEYRIHLYLICCGESSNASLNRGWLMKNNKNSFIHQRFSVLFLILWHLSLLCTCISLLWAMLQVNEKSCFMTILQFVTQIQTSPHHVMIIAACCTAISSSAALDAM